jgi:hypothetical protein
MPWAYASMGNKPGRVLAWSALMAVTLLLALLLQAFAAGALVETGPVGPPDVCLSRRGRHRADSDAIRNATASAMMDAVAARYVLTCPNRSIVRPPTRNDSSTEMQRLGTGRYVSAVTLCSSPSLVSRTIGDGSDERWETFTVHPTQLALGWAVTPVLVALFMAATPALAKCDANHGPDECRDLLPLSATPELGSLVLFGTGLVGAGGYALTRFRARRRQDEHVESGTT